MAYSFTNALADLKNQIPFLAKTIIHESLIGIVDGSNKLFYLPYVPCQIGSLVVHDSTGTVLTPAGSDLTTGAITLSSAPTNSVYGDYTALAISDARLQSFVTDGFAEMQSRYPRTMFLTTSGTETYVSSDAGAVVDPTCGTLTFSTSPTQKRLFTTCIKYAFYSALYEDTALRAKYFKESGISTGITIDESKMPGNILDMLRNLNEQLKSIVLASESEVNGEVQFGAFIPGAVSDQYINEYDWYTDSQQYNGTRP